MNMKPKDIRAAVEAGVFVAAWAIATWAGTPLPKTRFEVQQFALAVAVGVAYAAGSRTRPTTSAWQRRRTGGVE